MSKIALNTNSSGTGIFSIASPNSNNDRTLTLPDSTGTILNDQSTVSSTQIASALNASGSAPLYACRAWVNFNGTGTVAIRASGNVSSITDNGTGNYTVNFTTAMPDTNYAVSASVDQAFWSTAIGSATYTTSSVVLRVTGESAYRDGTFVGVSIFR